MSNLDSLNEAKGVLNFSQSILNRMQQPQQIPQPIMNPSSRAFQDMPQFPRKEDPLSFQRTTAEVPQTLQSPPEIFETRGAKIGRNEIDSHLRPTLFGEISNRPPEKQELEARTILNTVINRMNDYGKHGMENSLSKVLSMPHQYQAYGGKQFQAYKNGGNELDAKKKEQIDGIVDRLLEEIKSGKFEDNTNNAYYYQHNSDGSITYDDKRELIPGDKKGALATFLSKMTTKIKK